MIAREGITASFIGVEGYPGTAGQADVFLAFGIDLLHDGNNYLINEEEGE